MNQTLPSCGIDKLLQDEPFLASLAKRRIGLVTNQNTLTQDYQLSAHALAKQLGKSLKCILTPEHGWSGFIAEGIKVGDGFDHILELPIFSLYGGEGKYLEFIRQEKLDLLLIDLQDVGVRCYTYVSTCAQLLEACSDFPLEVIVCDRPNPLGPSVKGPLLDPRLQSLVGYVPTAFQHGETIGQLLSTFNQTLERELLLTVISCEPYHQPYQYPWISPSPNLPTWESVLLYPALVLLEGTNVSEGRGTSLPFTSLGAPGLNQAPLVAYLNEIDEGMRARPLTFTPQSGKHKGVECQGAHIILTDFSKLKAFETGIKILSFLKKNYENFVWEKMIHKTNEYFIDYLVGTNSLRMSINKKT